VTRTRPLPTEWHRTARQPRRVRGVAVYRGESRHARNIRWDVRRRWCVARLGCRTYVCAPCHAMLTALLASCPSPLYLSTGTSGNLSALLAAVRGLVLVPSSVLLHFSLVSLHEAFSKCHPPPLPCPFVAALVVASPGVVPSSHAWCCSSVRLRPLLHPVCVRRHGRCTF
jgi:hypothetical protein